MVARPKSRLSYLGILATTMGYAERAVDHFAHAMARHEQMGAVPYIALTQGALANALARRGRPGDDADAEALRERALSTATDLGMRSLEQRLRRVEKFARSPQFSRS
jgi:hypothetical protein